MYISTNNILLTWVFEGVCDFCPPFLFLNAVVVHVIFLFLDAVVVHLMSNIIKAFMLLPQFDSILI